MVSEFGDPQKETIMKDSGKIIDKKEKESLSTKTAFIMEILLIL